MSVIGRLEIELLANVARLQKDMDAAKHSVGGAMDSINKAVGGAQKLLLGLGVGISFSALIGQVNKAIDTLGMLDDMAQKTGSSVENLSRMQKVAAQFGGDFTAVDTAISKLAKGLAGVDDAGGKTAKALQAIGISQQFVKANDPSQVMVEVAKKLQNYQDGAGKAALATDLFGKSGAELLPYLNDVAENIDKFIGVSAEASAQAAKVQDQMGGMKVKFDEVFQTLAISLLPVMSDFIDNLTGTSKNSTALANNRTLHDWADSLADKFAFVADAINSMAIPFKYVGSLVAQTAALVTPKGSNANAQALAINQAASEDRTNILNSASFFRDRLASNRANGIASGSPYVSPNSDKTVLNYAGAEADAAMQAQREANAKKLAADEKRSHEEKLRQQKEFFDLDQKYNKIMSETESKIIDESRKKEAEAYKDKLEQLDKLQKVANDNFDKAQTQAAKLEEDRQKDFEKTVDGINQVFREGFANMVNGGKGTWKSFTKSLITTFKTTVADQIYRMLAQPFVIKLVASIMGIGISGAASAGTAALSLDTLTGTGSNSLLGTISDGLSSLNTNVVGSIQNLGAFLSTGNGGLGDTIGGALGQYANEIATGLSFAPAVLSLLKGDVKSAAFQGAGAAIGTIIGGPVGGAIGSFLGGAVGGLFGGKKPKHPVYITEASSTYQDGKLTSNFSTLAGAGKEVHQLGANDSVTSVSKAFSASLSTLLTGFDFDGKILSNMKLWKRKAAIGFFDAIFDGGKINLKTDLGRGDTTEAFNRFFEEVLSTGIVKAIQNTKLPEGIKMLFADLTDSKTVNSMINASLALNAAQAELASRFSLTVDQAGKVSKATALEGDELVAFVNKLATAASSFRSVGDILLDTKAKLNEGLGGSVPDTLKDFDNILKGIDKTTQAGIDSFAELFSFRDQFIAFTSTLNGLKTGVRGSIFSMSSDAEKQAMMQEDLAKLFGELGMNVPGSVEELINLGKSIDYTTKEGLDLAAVFPSLVTAFSSAKQQTDALATSLESLDTSRFKTLVDFTRAQRYVDNGISLNKLPGFASGGDFAGGLRIVGENGPELEATGPSRIINNQELMNNLRNPENNSSALIAEIGRLRQENQAQQVAIVQATQKMAKILDKFDNQGIALSETNNSGTRIILDTRTVP